MSAPTAPLGKSLSCLAYHTFEAEQCYGISGSLTASLYLFLSRSPWIPVAVAEVADSMSGSYTYSYFLVRKFLGPTVSGLSNMLARVLYNG